MVVHRIFFAKVITNKRLYALVSFNWFVKFSPFDEKVYMSVSYARKL